MEATKLLKCSCKNGYQDKKYGEGIRVHNYAEKGNKTGPGYRCTVCGTVKTK